MAIEARDHDTRSDTRRCAAALRPRDIAPPHALDQGECTFRAPKRVCVRLLYSKFMFSCVHVSVYIACACGPPWTCGVVTADRLCHRKPFLCWMFYRHTFCSGFKQKGTGTTTACRISIGATVLKCVVPPALRLRSFRFEFTVYE